MGEDEDLTTEDKKALLKKAGWLETDEGLWVNDHWDMRAETLEEAWDYEYPKEEEA
jgi:hypothetical protein